MISNVAIYNLLDELAPTVFPDIASTLGCFLLYSIVVVLLGYGVSEAFRLRKWVSYWLSDGEKLKQDEIETNKAKQVRYIKAAVFLLIGLLLMPLLIRAKTEWRNTYSAKQVEWLLKNDREALMVVNEVKKAIYDWNDKLSFQKYKSGRESVQTKYDIHDDQVISGEGE